MTTVGHEIRLAARPNGPVERGHFTLARVELAEPIAGQVLVRNLFMSVDPYMRSRMDEGMIHSPSFQVGQALDGAAIGEVVDSRDDGLRPGDIVAHRLGWRDYALAAADAFRPVPEPVTPLSTHLGLLGMPGMTAWVGLRHIAELRPGETVFVSGAAGAVGSAVGQLVRVTGGRVIGSAGVPAKVELLTSRLHFDGAINYRTESLVDRLRALAPDGIDVYFDNVGGSHLEAALHCLKPFGRIVACGMISRYGGSRDGRPPQNLSAPQNLSMLVGKRITLKGFVVSDHRHLEQDFENEMRELLRQGRIVPLETRVQGLAQAPDALMGLFTGANVGKMVVAL